MAYLGEWGPATSDPLGEWGPATSDPLGEWGPATSDPLDTWGQINGGDQPPQTHVNLIHKSKLWQRGNTKQAHKLNPNLITI